MAANQESNKLKQREAVTVFKSSSLLHFPRPHQLGVSSGLYSSRASVARVSSPHWPLSTPHDTVTPQLTGQDEVDFVQGGPPPCTTLLKRKGPAKPIVKTFDERPLNELILYLPPKLPLSIADSKQALSNFVMSTSVSYVTMWELEKNLRILNLQFPAQYAEKLASDSQFLNTFLQNLFDQLNKIKSIEQLFLPEIALNSLIDLSLILQPIVDSGFAIAHLVLPISSEMCEKDLKQADVKKIASLFRKLNIKNVTLMSSDGIVSVLADKLSRERYRKNSSNVSYSNRHLGPPGPHYIADMNQPAVCGEVVDPLSLVDSLNTSPAEHFNTTALHAHKTAKKVSLLNKPCIIDILYHITS